MNEAQEMIEQQMMADIAKKLNAAKARRAELEAQIAEASNLIVIERDAKDALVTNEELSAHTVAKKASEHAVKIDAYKELMIHRGGLIEAVKAEITTLDAQRLENHSTQYLRAMQDATLEVKKALAPLVPLIAKLGAAPGYTHWAGVADTFFYERGLGAEYSQAFKEAWWNIRTQVEEN